MVDLLIAFMGNRKGGVHFDNIICKVSDNKLSEGDLLEIKECIAYRFDLDSVVILNIIELSQNDHVINLGSKR